MLPVQELVVEVFQTPATALTIAICVTTWLLMHKYNIEHAKLALSYKGMDSYRLLELFYMSTVSLS